MSPLVQQLGEVFREECSRTWMLRRRDAVINSLRAMCYYSSAIAQGLLWDTTSVTHCALISFRDGELPNPGMSPAKIVVAISLSASVVEATPGEAGEPQLVFRQSLEVFDGFDVSAIQWADNSVMPFMERELRPWKSRTQFGREDVLGKLTMPLGEGPAWAESLERTLGIQLMAWSVDDNLGQLWDTVIDSVGSPGNNRPEAATMDQVIPALLESSVAEGIADQVLTQFEQQADKHSLTMSGRAMPGRLENSADADGVLTFEKAWARPLLVNGDVARYVLANWWARWNERTQQMEAGLQVHVQIGLGADGMHYEMELPPLNVSTKTLQRGNWLVNWVRSLAITAPEYQLKLAELVDRVDQDLMP